MLKYAMEKTDEQLVRIPPIKPKKFAEMLGVTVKTLQRWDRAGILTAHRTPTNRRYYTHEQYVEYMDRKPE